MRHGIGIEYSSQSDDEALQFLNWLARELSTVNAVKIERIMIERIDDDDEVVPVAEVVPQ